MRRPATRVEEKNERTMLKHERVSATDLVGSNSGQQPKLNTVQEGRTPRKLKNGSCTCKLLSYRYSAGLNLLVHAVRVPSSHVLRRPGLDAAITNEHGVSWQALNSNLFLLEHNQAVSVFGPLRVASRLSNG